MSDNHAMMMAGVSLSDSGTTLDALFRHLAEDRVYNYYKVGNGSRRAYLPVDDDPIMNRTEVVPSSITYTRVYALHVNLLNGDRARFLYDTLEAAENSASVFSTDAEVVSVNIFRTRPVIREESERYYAPIRSYALDPSGAVITPEEENL